MTQPFESFPTLADHIERMANSGTTGTWMEWCQFTEQLNMVIAWLQNERVSDWQPIETAPTDRWIWVYAPACYGLDELISICHWDDDAGFCVDELRHPSMWCEMIKPTAPRT